jgi:hypothetical protein
LRSLIVITNGRSKSKRNTAEVNEEYGIRERQEKKTEMSNFYYVTRESTWAERKEEEI